MMQNSHTRLFGRGRNLFVSVHERGVLTAPLLLDGLVQTHLTTFA